MAGTVYVKWKEELLKGTAGYDLDQTGADGVYAALLTSTAYNAAHDFYSDVEANEVGTAQEIPATKSYTNGVFKTTGTNTWTAVAAGSTVANVVLYRKNSGASSTWPLVAHLTSTEISGLPVATNGGDITITWDTTNGVFAL